jgi:hypothetical protein
VGLEENPLVDKGVLPEDGAARVGSVALPPGQRVYAEKGELVAWVTAEPVADAGGVWSELSGAHAETGLVPITLTPPRRPDVPGTGLVGEDFGFWFPADVSLLERMSADTVLAARWHVSDGDWEEESDYLVAARAPFGQEFPGLAPAGDARLSAAVLELAVAVEPSAHLGLVAARRPADVPAVAGWSVFGVDFPGPGVRSLQISAVLRSWETRYGARPLRIGNDATLRVLVERPPRTYDAAQRVAVEHLAFADECNGTSSYSVAKLGAALIDAPIWTFWWD